MDRRKYKWTRKTIGQDPKYDVTKRIIKTLDRRTLRIDRKKV
jgi:hypothetical protein